MRNYAIEVGVMIAVQAKNMDEAVEFALVKVRDCGLQQLFDPVFKACYSRPREESQKEPRSNG